MVPTMMKASTKSRNCAKKKCYEGISLVENGFCAFYPCSNTLQTVAPATEADTDFDVLLCIGWCAAWWPAVLTAATVTLEEPRRTSLLSRICSGGDVLMV
jgi:hypothetical protein